MMGLKKKSSKLAMVGYILAPFVSLAMYFLIINRQLPFLKKETVFSGGEYVPTEQFIELISPMFLYMVPVFIVVGVISYFYLKNKEQGK